ncbi:MAG: cyclase [Cenarchaeum symbiont of Oopsacas minuta]|nr:cyclase [Cenarchaeum symbiont of Oopsacas minuta]
MIEIAVQSRSYMGMVDLTMTVSPNMEAFPGSPLPQFVKWAHIDQDGYNMELVFMSSHTGTHMDAPIHFNKNGASIDTVPLSRLICNASLIRVKLKTNGTITKSDITAFESKYDKLVPGQAVVFATRWSDQIKRRGYFERNPGISYNAAAYLILRKIGIVGIDSPSIDAGNAHSYPAHNSLCKAGIPIVENLINLGRIPKQNFTLVVMPMKLRGATGSPTRAMALWDNDAPHKHTQS